MIVCCGEALVDLVPDPVPGGGPMNAAVAAARLGAPAAFVGRISTDEHGQRIWDHLRANDVDLSAVERGDEPTARAIVEHEPKLSFRFEGDGTADTCLGRVDLSALGDGPHIVHGGTLGMFRGRTAEVLADFVERHDGIVSLDPNVRPQIIDDRDRWMDFHRRWADRAHLYKGSDEDLDWIFPGRAIESVAEELLAGRCAAVILTRGADGAMAYTTDGTVDVGAPSVEVVDTVGAGDTFVAGVLVSLWEQGLADRPDELARLDDARWAQALRLGVDAAAVNVTRPGADPPTRDELAAVG